MLNTPTGGVAGSWMLLDMVARGMVPAALVLNSTNPILAQGAAFANLGLVHQFELDINLQIRSGDRISVYPAEGLVPKRPLENNLK